MRQSENKNEGGEDMLTTSVDLLIDCTVFN